MESRMASATNSVGLWWSSLGGAWGYRAEMRRQRVDLVAFLIPSLLGGAAGAGLLLCVSTALFDRLVPILILLATLLFAVERPISRWLRSRDPSDDSLAASGEPKGGRRAGMFLAQFGVALYGGFFGASIGILLLAQLGFLGITNLHERNGLKNIAVLAIKGAAVGIYAAGGKVDWPVALCMGLGSIVGGYVSALVARWLGQRLVGWIVIAIGLAAAAYTAWPQT